MERKFWWSLVLFQGFILGTVEMSLARNRRINAEGEILEPGFITILFFSNLLVRRAHGRIFGSASTPHCSWRRAFSCGRGCSRSHSKMGNTHSCTVMKRERRLSFSRESQRIGTQCGRNNKSSRKCARHDASSRTNRRGTKDIPIITYFLRIPVSIFCFDSRIFQSCSGSRKAIIFSGNICFAQNYRYHGSNTSKTARRVFSRPNLTLERRIFWGISTTENPLEIAQELIESEAFLTKTKSPLSFS